jgi:hypothetical protein
MQNTAGFGRLIGWISIVMGAAALLIAMLVDSPEVARAEFERCMAQIRMGFRQATCPPPTTMLTQPILIGAGAGALAAGAFFLLLSGILATLVEIRDDQRAQHRSPEWGAGRASAALRSGRLPPDHTANAPAPKRALPTRFEMQQRYGERLGNLAWAMMDTALREGDPVSEADAVQRARSKIRAEQD